jgi:Alw26I/Eco31I/Esp3I family type II restriction m6 adenine DNA methyltransferase
VLHADQLKEIGLNKSDTLKKAIGKFYTPKLVANDLSTPIIEWIYKTEPQRVKVVDPFCGDGRLINCLLQSAHKADLNTKWEIELWDYEHSALANAKEEVEETISSLEINASVTAKQRDSLLESKEDWGTFDCVITNPPWDAVKPDSRELKKLSDDEVEEYKAALREYDRRLEEELPLSQPSRKYAGWGTNLSRCGTELSSKLLQEDGMCSIVVPLSLLMDQTSTSLRRLLTTDFLLSNISYYPAETRLFEDVDQESIAFSFGKSNSKGIHKDVEIKRYDKKKNVRSKETIDLHEDKIEKINYCIPVVFGASFFKMMQRWSNFSPLDSHEEHGSLWLGRELDETRHREWLCDDGEYLFMKGRMVNRFEIVEEPSSYVDESKKRVPGTADQHRIVWRDVARRSQARRVQATIIEPGIATGNSLHAGYFKDGNTVRLKALLGLFNSIPFEFQVRALLGTGHISLGVVRKVRIPPLNDAVVDTVSAKLPEGSPTDEEEAALEVVAARAYGLEQEHMEELLSHFRNLPDGYADRIMEHPLWESEKLRRLSSIVQDDANGATSCRGNQLSMIEDLAP